MLEKRRFHRFRYTAAGELIHNGLSYRGRLENISLNGALISFDDGVVVPQDDDCVLTVFLDGDNTPLKIVVKVVYSNFTMIGVKFALMEPEMRERLNNLVASLSTEPEKLRDELNLLARDSD